MRRLTGRIKRWWRKVFKRRADEGSKPAARCWSIFRRPPTDKFRIAVIGSFPIGCEVVLRFFERDLASADTAHGLDFNSIFSVRFFPRLKLQV